MKISVGFTNKEKVKKIGHTIRNGWKNLTDSGLDSIHE